MPTSPSILALVVEQRGTITCISWGNNLYVIIPLSQSNLAAPAD